MPRMAKNIELCRKKLGTKSGELKRNSLPKIV